MSESSTQAASDQEPDDRILLYTLYLKVGFFTVIYQVLARNQYFYVQHFVIIDSLFTI